MRGRRLLAGSFFVAAIAAWMPSTNALVARVRPSEIRAVTGDVVTLSIEIVGAIGDPPLGSYGAVLEWDADVLALIAVDGGDPPFDGPTVNGMLATEGRLRFADAAPAGAGSRTRVLAVTFEVLGTAGSLTSIELEFTSLFGAGGYQVLDTALLVVSGEACVPDVDLDLRLDGGSATTIRWNALGPRRLYDVIRGHLDELRIADGRVDLGEVTCLQAGSANVQVNVPDSTIPEPASGFFYLVRMRGESGIGYGLAGRCGELMRLAAVGDCP